MAQRIKLLIALVPIALLWWWLCLYAPFWGSNGFGSLGDGRRFCLYFYFDNNVRQQTLFDLSKLTLHVSNPDGIGLNQRKSGHIFRVGKLDDSSSIPQGSVGLKIDVLSEVDGKLLRSFEAVARADSPACIAADRFYVISDGRTIRWLDMDGEQLKWNTLLTSTGEGDWLYDHHELPYFWRTVAKIGDPSAPVTSTPPRFAELFRFDESGNLILVSTWPISHLQADGPYQAAFKGDEIITLSPSDSQVEFRSLKDGGLTRSVHLEGLGDADALGYSLNQYQITFFDTSITPRTFRFFSPTTGRERISPIAEADRRLIVSPAGRNELWISYAARDAAVVDRASDQLLCRFSAPERRFEFLDDDTLIALDEWWGLTIRRIDLRTGKSILIWRPYSWVLGFLFVTLSISTVWVWLWLRLPKANANWAWFDVLFVFAALMLLITTRLHSIGQVHELSRSPYAYASPLCAGFILTAWSQLFLGSGLWIVRVSRVLLVYAVVFAALGKTLIAVPSAAWIGLVSVSSPSLFVTPVLAIMSVLQVRKIRRPDRRPLSMQHLFGLTAACAVLFLVAQPMLPGLLSVSGSWWRPNLFDLCILAAGPLGLLATAVDPRLRRVATVAAVLSFIVMIVDPLASSVYVYWKPVRLETSGIWYLLFGACSFFFVTYIVAGTVSRFPHSAIGSDSPEVAKNKNSIHISAPTGAN